MYLSVGWVWRGFGLKPSLHRIGLSAKPQELSGRVLEALPNIVQSFDRISDSSHTNESDVRSVIKKTSNPAFAGRSET